MVTAMASGSRPFRLLAPLMLVSLAALAGCPDPQGAFDDFSKRYDKINGGSSSSGAGGAMACTAPAAGMADGDWLFSLSAKLSPKKAVAFKMAVTTTDAGGGALKMGRKATPLSNMDQMTPVGPEVDLGMFDVAADGNFDADLGTLTITGDANPITPGSDIVATASIHGSLCSQDPEFVCGTVDGQVMMPIMYNLMGSSFTMQKIDGGTIPAPVIDCAKTPAMY